MARNFLGFIVSATDGAYVSGDNIQHIEVVGATSVKVHFSGEDNTSGNAVLTVTNGKQYDVAKEVARIAQQGTGVITIGDSVAGNFAIADISAVASYSVN